MVKQSIELISGEIEKEHAEFLQAIENSKSKSETILEEINKMEPDEKSKLIAKLLNENVVEESAKDEQKEGEINGND